MNKKKICKMAGIGAISAAIVAGGVFYGMHQFGATGASSNGNTSSVQSIDAQSMSTTESGHEVTLHFKWKGSQPHMAYKVPGTDVATTTPGVPMNDEGNGWYTYTIKDTEEADVVISVPELDYTTSEFSRSDGEYWYDLDKGWYTDAPDNYEEPKTQKSKTQEAKPSDAPEKEITEEAVEVAESSKITIHYTSDWNNTYMYAWNALPDDIEMDWPGEKLKKDADGYFSYTFDATTKVNFLFSGDGNQTDDFSIKEAGEYWYNNGKWDTKNPSGDPSATDEPEKTDRPIKPTVGPSGPTSTPAPFERTDDFRDETIYFLMTTRFYDGDSSNNRYCWDDESLIKSETNKDPGWRGDFKGLIEKLDYIKALGFSAIWITPVVENASGLDYHGYHAYDFSRVDPRYETHTGSDDVTYQDLINACHEKKIKVVQDIVLNHTGNWGERNFFHMFDKDVDDGSSTRSAFMSVAEDGEKAENLQKGVAKYGRGAKTYNEIRTSTTIPDHLKDDSEYKSRLFAMKDDDIDTERCYHHYGNFEWESYEVQLGQMAGDCVDINTENPAVAKYLRECYINYINMGVDAFRIDTVKHISRLSFNKEFLPYFKEAGGEKFFMFGETCVRRQEVWNAGMPGISVPFYTWKESKDYAWGDTLSNEATVKQHFKDNASTDSQPTSDNAFLKGNEYHTPDRSMSSGLDQIDFYMHWAFRDANGAFDAAKREDPYFNDSTYNVTYIDSHDYAPDQAPESQRFSGTQDTWAENLDLIFTFRGIPCIYYGSEIEFMKGAPIDPMVNNARKPYKESGRAYFGDEIEGSVNATDFGVYSGATGKMAETLNYPLAKHIQRLNLIRRAVPALRRGQYSTDGCNGGICFKRRYTDSKTDSFVCVAISQGATFSGVPSGTYVDVVSGKTYNCDGNLTVSCDGKGNMAVCVLQTTGAANGKIGESGAYLK